MIKRMLALDGVMAICQFRDDGVFVKGYGVLEQEQMVGLAKFAHDYKRIVQANTDQLSMFTQMNGWTPPGGWVVKSESTAVISMSNFVCLAGLAEASLNEIMQALDKLAHW